MNSLAERLRAAFPGLDVRDKGESVLLIGPSNTAEIRNHQDGYSMRVVALNDGSGYDFGTAMIASRTLTSEYDLIDCLRAYFSAT